MNLYCPLGGRGIDRCFLVRIPLWEAHKSLSSRSENARNTEPAYPVHLSPNFENAGAAEWVILFPWGLSIAPELGVQHRGNHCAFLGSAVPSQPQVLSQMPFPLVSVLTHEPCPVKGPWLHWFLRKREVPVSTLTERWHRYQPSAFLITEYSHCQILYLLASGVCVVFFLEGKGGQQESHSWSLPDEAEKDVNTYYNKPKHSTAEGNPSPLV